MLKVTKVTLSHEGSGAIAMAALNFLSLKILIPPRDFKPACRCDEPYSIHCIY